MILSNWKEQNKDILASIRNYRFQKNNPKVLPGLLENFVLHVGHLNLYGEIGEKLRSFLKSVDLNHPELDGFLTSFLGLECLEEIEVLSELASFCVRKKHDWLIDRLKNVLVAFTKNNIPHHGKTLGDPLQTHAYTRFLPKNKLWLARESKKHQRITAAKNSYDSITQDSSALIAYHHNSDKSLQLKSELERKKAIFDSMNCVHLSMEIADAIKKIEDEIISLNFGFRRITLAAAGTCLMSMIGNASDIYLTPLTEQNMAKNAFLQNFVDACDNFCCFNNNYAVFDHYALIQSDDSKLGLIVAERDLKTFFIGYHCDE